MRKGVRLLASGGMGLGLLLSSIGSAQAADTCTDTVVDTTSDQVLDVSAIEAFSQGFESATGADVRVRAFEVAPRGGLEAYQESQVASCPSWRGPNGETKANLIVFAFSMEPQDSSMFYGTNFHELDDEWNRIRDEDMGNQFRVGDFTAGITDAMDETASVLNDAEEADAPIDWSGVGSFFAKLIAAIVAAVLLIALIFGAMRWRRNVQSKARAKEKAKRRALRAVADVSEESPKLYEFNDLHEKLVLAVAGLDNFWATKLTKAVNGVIEVTDEAERELAKLSNHPQRYDLENRSDLSTDGYNDVAEGHEEALAAVKKAVSAASTLSKTLDELKDLSPRDKVRKLEEPARKAEAARKEAERQAAARLKESERLAAERRRQAERDARTPRRRTPSPAPSRSSSSSSRSSSSRSSSSDSGTSFGAGYGSGYVSGGGFTGGGDSGGGGGGGYGGDGGGGGGGSW